MEQKINYYLIPFTVDIIENPIWPPGKDEWLFEDEKDKQNKEYSEYEKKVIFDDMSIIWDSCDCGDGYGCSHESWPYKINVGYDKDLNIEFVDNGLEIQKDGVGNVYFESIQNLSAGQFIDALRSLKIEIKFKNQDNGNSNE